MLHSTVHNETRIPRRWVRRGVNARRPRIIFALFAYIILYGMQYIRGSSIPSLQSWQLVGSGQPTFAQNAAAIPLHFWKYWTVNLPIKWPKQPKSPNNTDSRHSRSEYFLQPFMCGHKMRVVGWWWSPPLSQDLNRSSLLFCRLVDQFRPLESRRCIREEPHNQFPCLIHTWNFATDLTTSRNYMQRMREGKVPARNSATVRVREAWVIPGRREEEVKSAVRSETPAWGRWKGWTFLELNQELFKITWLHRWSYKVI